MRVKGKIARLTVEENRAWEFAFCFYREKTRMDLHADKLAWKDLIREFPRLALFDRCR
jgi:hypothetical protein